MVNRDDGYCCCDAVIKDFCFDGICRVEETLAEILKEDENGDHEASHGLEDEMYESLLEAIASGRCDTPMLCSQAALTTNSKEFPRWAA